MGLRFFLSVFLLPALCTAAVIPNCRMGDIFPGDPSGDIVLGIGGSKGAYQPPVTDCEYFDIWAIVTGTDQPGYLLLRTLYYHSENISSPTRIQGTGGSLMEEYFFNVAPQFLYVPYEAGIPVNLYGYVRGMAGAYDALRQPGSFYADMTIFIRVTSQMVDNPIYDNPMYIPGATWAEVPEPVSVALVVAGLALMVVCRGRRW